MISRFKEGKVMEQIISAEEKEIMRNAYIFLANHCNPPANQEACACDWWLQTVQEMGQLSLVWNNHPLMMSLLIAIIDYLDGKANKKTEEFGNV